MSNRFGLTFAGMAADVDLARRLRAARVLADIETREELARRLDLPGLSAKTLGAIERGERELRPHEIAPIAQALGVSVAFFTGNLQGTNNLTQLDRIESEIAMLRAHLEVLMNALEIERPDLLVDALDATPRVEDDGPAQVVGAVWDAAARAGALPEPGAQPSPRRRATR